MHLRDKVTRLERLMALLPRHDLESLSQGQKAALQDFGREVRAIMSGKSIEEQTALGKQIVRMVKEPIPAWMSDVLLRAEHEGDLFR